MCIRDRFRALSPVSLQLHITNSLQASSFHVHLVSRQHAYTVIIYIIFLHSTFKFHVSCSKNSTKPSQYTLLTMAYLEDNDDDDEIVYFSVR